MNRANQALAVIVAAGISGCAAMKPRNIASCGPEFYGSLAQGVAKKDGSGTRYFTPEEIRKFCEGTDNTIIVSRVKKLITGKAPTEVPLEFITRYGAVVKTGTTFHESDTPAGEPIFHGVDIRRMWDTQKKDDAYETLVPFPQCGNGNKRHFDKYAALLFAANGVSVDFAKQYGCIMNNGTAQFTPEQIVELWGKQGKK
jgi:hypothetical protein